MFVLCNCKHVWFVYVHVVRTQGGETEQMYPIALV